MCKVGEGKRAVQTMLRRDDRGRTNEKRSVRFSESDDSGIDVRQERKVEEVDGNEWVRELREQIRSMKVWRKELERSVVWLSEEGWRIREILGRKRDDRKACGEAGWAGGGRIWERRRQVTPPTVGSFWVGHIERTNADFIWCGGGRLPTQNEWERMFAQDRLVWEDQGAGPSREDRSDTL